MMGFSVGGVINKSFSIWFRNIIPFTILTLLSFAPLVIYVALELDSMDSLEDLARMMLVALGGAFLLRFVATGAVSYGVFMQLRGQHAGLGKCISVGVSRLLPVLGVAILMVIVIGGPAFLLVRFLEVIGLLIALVYLLVMTLMLYVAVPAAIIEKPGIVGALKRSADLTSGYKASIFGALFLIGIIQAVVNFIIGKIIEGSSLTTILVVNIAMQILVSSLGAVVCAVVYHDLRVTKEGVGTEELARVFD